MLVDTDLILLAVRLFLVKTNVRLKILWSQLRFLEQHYLLPNLPILKMKPLAEQEIIFVCCQ